MVEIHLHGALRKLRDAPMRFAARTPAVAVAACEALVPGFREAVARHGHRVMLTADGEAVTQPLLHWPLPAGTRELHIAPVPAGSDGGITAAGWIALALSAASLVYSITNKPEKSKQRHAEFLDGIVTTEEGHAIPVVYGGPCRVTPTIVSGGIDSVNGYNTRNTARLVDLICEGQIETDDSVVAKSGLRIDGAPAGDGVTVEWRNGEADQAYLGNVPFVQVERDVTETLRNMLDAPNGLTETVAATSQASLVRIRMRMPRGLYRRKSRGTGTAGFAMFIETRERADSSSPWGAWVQWVHPSALLLDRNGRAYVPERRRLAESPDLEWRPGSLSTGILSLFYRDPDLDAWWHNEREWEQPHEYSWDVPVTPGMETEVRLRRVDHQTLNDVAHPVWQGLTLITDIKLAYNNCAVAAVTLDEEFNADATGRTWDVKGLRVRVPSDYDGDARTYTGQPADWDGTLKAIREWTRNPAWCLFDMLASKRFGLGRSLDATVLMDALPDFYAFGRWCDEQVADGDGGMEPRLSLDVVMRDRRAAARVLRDIAESWQAFLADVGGGLRLAVNRPAEPLALVSQANVLDGVMERASATRDRFSAILVEWVDPDAEFARATEMVVDDALVAAIGWKEKNITAWGCQSRGQAHRHGRHYLVTQEHESESLSYTAGADHAEVRPGDIIRVRDGHGERRRLSGRVVATGRQSERASAAATESATVANMGRWFADFPDEMEDGGWHHLADGSTPDAGSGPGANNALPFIYVYDEDGGRGSIGNHFPLGGDLGDQFLAGDARRMTIRHCMMGDWSESPNVHIHFRADGGHNQIGAMSVAAWPYRDDYVAGQQGVMDEDGQPVEIVADGGWRDLVIDVPDEVGWVSIWVNPTGTFLDFSIAHIDFEWSDAGSARTLRLDALDADIAGADHAFVNGNRPWSAQWMGEEEYQQDGQTRTRPVVVTGDLVAADAATARVTLDAGVDVASMPVRGELMLFDERADPASLWRVSSIEEDGPERRVTATSHYADRWSDAESDARLGPALPAVAEPTLPRPEAVRLEKVLRVDSEYRATGVLRARVDPGASDVLSDRDVAWEFETARTSTSAYPETWTSLFQLLISRASFALGLGERVQLLSMPLLDIGTPDTGYWRVRARARRGSEYGEWRESDSLQYSGLEIEQIFRMTSGQNPGTPVSTEAQLAEDDHVPTGWLSSRPTVTEGQVVWSVARYGFSGDSSAMPAVPGQWTQWSVAAVWDASNLRGADGADGQGAEWIFARSAEALRASQYPDAGWGYDVAETQAGQAGTRNGITWHDGLPPELDPAPADGEWLYIAQRRVPASVRIGETPTQAQARGITWQGEWGQPVPLISPEASILQPGETAPTVAPNAPVLARRTHYSLTLGTDAVAGATAYQFQTWPTYGPQLASAILFVGQPTGNISGTIGWTDLSQQNRIEILPDTDYSARVRATNAHGVGPWSTVAEMRTLPSPVRPALVMTSAAVGEIISGSGNWDVMVTGGALTSGQPATARVSADYSVKFGYGFYIGALRSDYEPRGGSFTLHGHTDSRMRTLRYTDSDGGYVEREFSLPASI